MLLLQFLLVIHTIFPLVFIDCLGYSGPIAGNKNVSECITGSKDKRSELEITPSEFIKKEGYKAEDHLVKTEDGYLLTLTRIPGRPNASVVLIHHGFPFTAFDWVGLGKNRALAFLLADEGYDVWLGNTRGGLYSRCHVKYTTSEYRFWNFSFQEMASYDLPSEINYIEKIRGSVDMYYIGMSMGTTISYILAVERPDLASKFKVLLGLGPIAFLQHVRGVVPFFAPFATPIAPIVSLVLHGEIFEENLAKSIIQDFCVQSRLTQQICLFLRFMVFGFDYSQVDYSADPLFLNHGFVPSAFKIAVHFSQLINSGKFRKYDYGFLGNLKAYNSLTPPEYDVSKIQTPVGLIWAENDFLSTEKDVKKLHSKLSTVKLYHKVDLPQFNHLDFSHGKNASQLVYARIISTIRSFENGS